MPKNLNVAIISNQKNVYEEIKNEIEDSGLEIDLTYIEESSFNKATEIKSDAVVFVGSEKVSLAVTDYCRKNKINLIDYSASVPEAKMLYEVYKIFSEFEPEYFSANLMFSASYYGEEGVAELTNQTISLFNQTIMENAVFPKRIAFNILPGLGRVMDDGKTIIESGIESLMKKMISNPKLNICVNTMVVPIIAGIAANISLKANSDCKISKIEKIFEDSNKFLYYSELNDLPTVLDLEKDKIHVGRLMDSGNGYFSLFVIADNIKTLRVLPVLEHIKAG